MSDLIDGEKAAEIRVLHDGETKATQGWLLVLDYGWAETVVAHCSYERHARWVADCMGEALDCPVRWPDHDQETSP